MAIEKLTEKSIVNIVSLPSLTTGAYVASDAVSNL